MGDFNRVRNPKFTDVDDNTSCGPQAMLQIFQGRANGDVQSLELSKGSQAWLDRPWDSFNWTQIRNNENKSVNRIWDNH